MGSLNSLNVRPNDFTDLQLNSGLSEIARVDETGEFGGIFLNTSFKFNEDYDAFPIAHKDWLRIAGELAVEMGTNSHNS